LFGKVAFGNEALLIGAIIFYHSHSNKGLLILQQAFG